MNVSPRLLLVRRGQEEESFHCGRVVVATATGETVLAIGDADACFSSFGYQTHAGYTPCCEWGCRNIWSY